MSMETRLRGEQEQMVKLYLPYGNAKNMVGRRQVTLHWFVKEREQPVAPYTQLVQGYGQLTKEMQERAEQMVDELFTKEEFMALRLYLYDRHKEDLRTEVLVPPISLSKQDNSKNRALVRPFGMRDEDEGSGFCKLCDEENYGLPFPVWGYYTTPAQLLFPKSVSAVT